MRGTDQQQSHVFSYISPEQRVPRDHPLRPIRTMVDEILKQLSPQFNKMYAKVGRPSIPPEQLLRAQLLQMLYSVRSERIQHLQQLRAQQLLRRNRRATHFRVHLVELRRQLQMLYSVRSERLLMEEIGQQHF